MKLETKRLFLREMTPEDFDAPYAVLADSDIMRHYPYTFDEARVKNWINKNTERYRVFGFGLWADCRRYWRAETLPPLDAFIESRI